MNSNSNIVYRPPLTDSEDEYDGFYFGGDPVKKTNIRWTSSKSDKFYDAIFAGELETFKELLKDRQFNVDENINGGLTALLHACKNGYVDFVEYLLEDLHASPNAQWDSLTPLMLACDLDDNYQRKDPWIVERLVKILLKYGAEINDADRYRTTPFILACKHGYTAAVKLMIKKAQLDDGDNMGSTPLFHAIENNHSDIVKLLIEAGANTEITNAKGYTTRQVAQFKEFYDLLELLPKEKERYCIPASYLFYGTLTDVIPRLCSLKPNCPEYFQEIYHILLSLKLEQLLVYFAKEHIRLRDFLCIENERLNEIGISRPIYGMKIQKGLLDIHLHYWRGKPIARIDKSGKDNFYQILMIVASHLKDLVVMKSSLSFIKKNILQKKLGNVSNDEIEEIEYSSECFRRSLNDLTKTLKYLASFSPKQNPLYIDFDEIQKERKRRKIRRLVKFTTFIIGIFAFICFKLQLFQSFL